MTASQQSTFFIHDLCCPTEEQTIRKKLEQLRGIQSLEFNVISHKLVVRHSVPQEEILRTLKDIGLPGYVADTAVRAKKTLSNDFFVAFLISAAFWQFGGIFSFFNAPALLPKILFLISIGYGGIPIAARCFRSLKNRVLDINVLMTIAVLGAVGIQKYGEAAAIVVLYMFSLLLESKSTDKARRALQDLLKFTPPTATVKRNGHEVSIPAEQINVGEIIVIRPGERLPLDGEVVSGSSSVDQAPITGESMPVPKRTGDAVFAGSFNQFGTLDVRVTKIATDSTLARIIHLVEDAQSKKAPMQTFVERFAMYYTPAVFALAILVAAVPPVLFGAGFLDWFYRALVLLVIACPCAFVISTPVSLISAMTNAARHGILLKGGKHLETLAKVRAVAFDKTGTLTRGKPVVTDILSLNGMSPNDILRVAASAELKSEHHLAEALLVKAHESGISVSGAQVEEFTAIAGKGIRATIDGRLYVVGNHQLIEDMGVCSPEVEEILQRLELQGKTVLVLSDERSVLGVIAVADRIRAESAAAVTELHRLGVEKVVLLTGDNEAIASATATELSLDEVKAQLLPQEKLQAIQELKSRHAPVVMVGDGINDAPALAAADVGIAMGRAGSDTALETADVVLMSDNIAKVPYAIALGKRTLRIIKQNIALALLTKLVFLVLGVFGLTSLWLAILADDGATLVVLLNGMRLLRTKA